mmetsp:Transcript_39010/g.125281  ORF Transcript_39010/g.125281 Transcript_39010/m.125281 type:complete len:237 (+) Transcript_39010:469-1179(+)
MRHASSTSSVAPSRRAPACAYSCGSSRCPSSGSSWSRARPPPPPRPLPPTRSSRCSTTSPSICGGRMRRPRLNSCARPPTASGSPSSNDTAGLAAPRSLPLASTSTTTTTVAPRIAQLRLPVARRRLPAAAAGHRRPRPWRAASGARWPSSCARASSCPSQWLSRCSAAGWGSSTARRRRTPAAAAAASTTAAVAPLGECSSLQASCAPSSASIRRSPSLTAGRSVWLAGCTCRCL